MSMSHPGTEDLLHLREILEQYQSACRERIVAEEELERELSEQPAPDPARLAAYYDSHRRQEFCAHQVSRALPPGAWFA